MKLIDLLNYLLINVDDFYSNIETYIKKNPEKFENYSINDDFKDILLSHNVKKLMGGDDAFDGAFLVDFYPVSIFIYDLRLVTKDVPWLKPWLCRWRTFSTEDKGEHLLDLWFRHKMLTGEKSIFQEKIDELAKKKKEAEDKLYGRNSEE